MNTAQVEVVILIVFCSLWLNVFSMFFGIISDGMLEVCVYDYIIVMSWFQLSVAASCVPGSVGKRWGSRFHAWLISMWFTLWMLGVLEWCRGLALVTTDIPRIKCNLTRWSALVERLLSDFLSLLRFMAGSKSLCRTGLIQERLQPPRDKHDRCCGAEVLARSYWTY